MDHYKILCVDDNTALGEVLVQLLSASGHAVTYVKDGYEAWEHFETSATSYHLVITDHDMPRVNGLELVRRLRLGGYDGRIIVHTSGLRPGMRERYQALGIDRIIPKGLSTQELLEVVATVDTSDG